MVKGDIVTFIDGKHTATVTKVVSNESFIIEYIGKNISFVRLIRYIDYKLGINFVSEFELL